MNALSDLETRCVLPYYLKMMGLNALQHRVDFQSLTEVGQRTSDDEVVRLLRGAWRPRAMGAWFSVGRRDPDVLETLLWSLTTSAGSLTAPPLATAAVVNVGARAVDALLGYLVNDVAHADGSGRFIGAALEHLGVPTAGVEVTDRDRSALAGMLAVAARLAGENTPPDRAAGLSPGPAQAPVQRPARNHVDTGEPGTHGRRGGRA